MSFDRAVFRFSAAEVAADKWHFARDGTVIDRMAEDSSRNALANSELISLQAVSISNRSSASALNIGCSKREIYLFS